MSKRQLARVRKMCLAIPKVTERLSHGEPTWFAGKRVVVMFANNHHDDGRVAVWLPAEVGMQAKLIKQEPAKYFRPPYVGCRGWIGIVLREIADAELNFQIQVAWKTIHSSTKRESRKTSTVPSSNKQSRARKTRD